jgi:hypothetical protein
MLRQLHHEGRPMHIGLIGGIGPAATDRVERVSPSLPPAAVSNIFRCIAFMLGFRRRLGMGAN